MFLMYLVLISNYGQVINHNTAKGPYGLRSPQYRKMGFFHRNTAKN